MQLNRRKKPIQVIEDAWGWVSLLGVIYILALAVIEVTA